MTKIPQKFHGTKCIWCSSPLEISLEEITLSQYPISSAFPSNPDHHHYHSIIASTCSYCHLSQIVTSSDQKLLGSINTEICYAEPKGHHMEIAKHILSHFETWKSKLKLRCMSKKDHELINCIKSYDINEKISSSYSMEQEADNDIVIATRWLEHCNANDLIVDLFSSVSVGGLLIIECLDFKEMASMGNYSFIWDERVSYISSEYIINFASYFGHSLLHAHYNKSSAEPFWSLVFLKQDKLGISNTISKQLYQNNIASISIADKISTITKYCESFLVESGEYINILGASHKTLFIAGIIKNIAPNTKISVFDSSLQKINRYWGEHKIRPIEVLMASRDPSESLKSYIFSFQNNFSNEIKRHLHSCNPHAIFSDVSSFYREQVIL